MPKKAFVVVVLLALLSACASPVLSRGEDSSVDSSSAFIASSSDPFGESSLEESSAQSLSEPVASTNRAPFEGDAPKKTRIDDLWFTLREDGTYSVRLQSSTPFEIKTMNIPSEVEGRPVTEIEEYGFSALSAMAEITLPETIERFGECAFFCSGISMIKLPTNLLFIGDKAFDGCASLCNITFNERLETIGEYAFRDTSIVQLDLPKSLRNVSGKSFLTMRSLSSVSVAADNPFLSMHGDSLFDFSRKKLIRYFGFSARQSDSPVSLMIDTEEIGEYAFYGSWVSEVTFGSETRKIGASAFAASRLEKVILNEGLLSLGEKSFYVDGLSVTLPLSLQEDPYDVIIHNGIDACSLIVPENHPRFENRSGFLVRKADGTLIQPLCPIGERVEIPDGIASIGKGAFSVISGPSQIRYSVVFPSSLRHIEERAFLTIKTIDSISFNEGLLSIGDDAFRSNGNKCLINQPEGRLILPSSLKTIGAGALTSFNGLNELVLPPSLCTLGRNALPFISKISVDADNPCFASKDGFVFDKTMSVLIQAPKEVDRYSLPEGLVRIGEFSFYLCRGDMDISFPSTLQTIGEGAFYSSRLSSLDLSSSSVKTIESHAFASCGRLSNIAFPSSLREIGNLAFAGCAIQSAVLSATQVNVIGDSAFASNYGLTSLLLPQGIKRIGSSVISGSGIVSLSLPSDIEFMGDFCLGGCEKLVDLRYEGLSTEWNEIDLGWWINRSSGFSSVICTDKVLSLPVV